MAMSAPVHNSPTATASSRGLRVKPIPKFSAANTVGMVVTLAVALVLAISAIRNENFQWDVVFKYFFSIDIVRGLWTTLWLSFCAIVIGLVLGTIIALMRLSTNPVLNWVGSAYVWFFRGTPLLVQLIFWFNLSALYTQLGLTIPFGPTLFAVNTNAVITPITAALLGLGLHAAGYMAEVVRGGITGVDQTQIEAASALGMDRITRFRKIVWPQALRLIIPPVGNRIISEIKDTSLVSVIAIPDVLYSAQIIYSRTFETIPLLLVATIWYLIVVSVLSLGQFLIERHLARSIRTA